MNYRCHECGELFESHHTNYKHAKGYHPQENPLHSLEEAQKLDHCSNCQLLRNYDPVAARKNDMVMAAGSGSPRELELTQQIEALHAKVSAMESQKQKEGVLESTLKDLQAKIAAMTPTPPAPAAAG